MRTRTRTTNLWRWRFRLLFLVLPQLLSLSFHRNHHGNGVVVLAFQPSFSTQYAAIFKRRRITRRRRIPFTATTITPSLLQEERIPSLLFLATSSSELKKTKRKAPPRSSLPKVVDAATTKSSSSAKRRTRKPASMSVAKRLVKAAQKAQERSTELKQEDTTDNDVDTDQEHRPLASLQQLTKAIDDRLRANSPDARNRDSMTLVMRHNRQHSHFDSTTTTTTVTTSGSSSINKNPATLPPDREVAIVLAKPLQQDCLTLEYAQRIRRLVRRMLDIDHISDDETDNDNININNTTRLHYRPDVICFVGPQSTGNILCDADVGYMYFQFLCAAHGVDTTGIDIHLVKGSVAEGALQQIAYFLQETCLPAWLRASQAPFEPPEAPLPEPESPQEPDNLIVDNHTENIMEKDDTSPPKDVETVRTPRKRNRLLRVHFSLISSEYELCQLNDIHLRSPGQSVLRALESWSQRSFSTTWSYMYVTTVLTPDHNGTVHPAQAFLAKTYKTAQQLLPVIQNLRNVVRNREFFQTESYRVLVAARRSLVSDMESLYGQQPQLKAVHNWRHDTSRPLLLDNPHDIRNKPVDVVLEGALLLLGRCVDIVRPAGLLTGSPVSQADWKLALMVLRQAFEAITTVCDTDRPLEPQEWILLGDETDDMEDDLM